ncbi:MAG TPA: hypothetical protein VFA39_15555 [Steroidobacteraceae bacterium]|nr:hypothetical protein [Steroidobacteraceae bacterium]
MLFRKKIFLTLQSILVELQQIRAQVRRINEYQFRTLRRVEAMNTTLTDQQQAFAALQAEVARETDIVSSINLAFQGLQDQISALLSTHGDSVPASAIRDLLAQQKGFNDALTAAAVANTQAAAPPAGNGTGGGAEPAPEPASA